MPRPSLAPGHATRRFPRHNLYFPRLDLIITTIAKTGTTSVRTLFTAAELAVSDQRNANDLAGATERLLLPGQSIYSSGLPSFSLKSDPPPTAIRVVVLRHPVDRLMSMFVNKVVDLTDPSFYEKHLWKDWQLDAGDTLAEVRHKMLVFLDWLEDGHLDDDVHWAPQSWSILTDRPYDVAVDTGDLKTLPGRLADMRPDLRWMAEVEMPVRNASVDDLHGLILTDEITNRIESIYRSDIDVRAELRIDTPRRSVSDQLDAETRWDELSLRLAQRRERNSRTTIEMLLTSNSWRLTGPLRRRSRLIRRAKAQAGNLRRFYRTSVARRR